MKLETKVGAFFTAAICVIGWLIIRTEKLEFFGSTPKRAFTAMFDQAAGLPKQSKVRIAGVEVGKVQDIQLVNGKAIVSFTVEENIPLYANAVASLANIGILGEKYIDLNPGNLAAGLAKPGDQLASTAGVGLDALMDSIGAIAEDLKGITHALNESIGGEQGRMKLDEIVDNIKTLTAEFRAMAQENHGAINRTMANIESISHEFRERLPMLAKQFEDLGTNLNAMITENRPEIAGITSDVRKLAAGFNETSDNLKNIMAKLNNGEGTIGKLLTDDSTIEKLNTAVDSVNNMLSGMNKMELRLDMEAAQWTSRSNSRVGLGIELAPRNDYWYSLAFASTPDGRIRDETITIDPISGTKLEDPVSVRKINSEQMFTISAQFNKRIGEHLVLHAGVIDGFGGAGAEFRAFKDRFRLSALAYDFTKREEKENPRYRATTSLEFWKGLYAQVGVQDIANKETRSFFFGGGIRWKDDDIKKLVGLAGMVQ
jgi:phospholipid/cholesterol/gamma-HCH transport system substrate-binding protein